MPENLKRKNYPFCGRLIVLGKQSRLDVLNDPHISAGLGVINFPAMPENIELARNTDYMVVTNPAFPDGIHQYKGTQPLRIPISFQLHSMDREYCPKGALSLLQVAAEMEALVLPFGSDDILVSTGPPSESAAPNAAAGADTKPEQTKASIAKQADSSVELRADLAAENYTILPPATCYLELIITDRQSPGILCVGYVSEVKVSLHGPWLRGPGISQNLPSSGEFSFTFVHHPGHGNTYNFGAKNPFSTNQERQAFAERVRSRLFNTHDLLTHGNWHGFGDAMPVAGVPKPKVEGKPTTKPELTPSSLVESLKTGKNVPYTFRKPIGL